MTQLIRLSGIRFAYQARYIRQEALVIFKQNKHPLWMFNLIVVLNHKDPPGTSAGQMWKFCLLPSDKLLKTFCSPCQKTQQLTVAILTISQTIFVIFLWFQVKHGHSKLVWCSLVGKVFNYYRNQEDKVHKADLFTCPCLVVIWFVVSQKTPASERFSKYMLLSSCLNLCEI